MPVRRITRIVSVLGGIAAIIWAMRERFVSVAISREPTPPAFRVPEPATPIETAGSDLTAIDGIGPVYAARLTEAGYRTIPELAGADAGDVARAAQVSETRARTWIEAAVTAG